MDIAKFGEPRWIARHGSRLVEDEVGNRLVGYSSRKRVGEAEGSFASRKSVG